MKTVSHVVTSFLFYCTKICFPLRISSASVTKSAVSCRCGHIYLRNLLWKTSIFYAVSTTFQLRSKINFSHSFPQGKKCQGSKLLTYPFLPNPDWIEKIIFTPLCGALKDLMKALRRSWNHLRQQKVAWKQKFQLIFILIQLSETYEAEKVKVKWQSVAM